jgi:hypothetical protein
MAQGADLGRPLGHGQAIDLWQLTAPEERPFLAEPEPMPAATPARVADAYWRIGDLPCRKLLRRTLLERVVEAPAALDWVEHGMAARLEVSSFWHVPTQVWRFARTLIEVEAAGHYALRVTTCGGATLWVGGTAAASWTPFTRNRPSGADIHLALAAGRNEILLRLEELCERDTVWLVELTWQDERPARLLVPAPGGAATLDHLRRLAGSLRLDREGYGTEPVRLLLPEPAAVPLTVTLSGVGKGNAIPEIAARQVVVPAGDTGAEFGPGTGFPQGYHELGLTLEAGGMRLHRKLAAGFADPSLAAAPHADRAVRRRQALDYIARHGGQQIGRALALALALAEVGGDPLTLQAILTATLERIERREDCSDFWILPLIHLWRTRPQALGSLGPRTRTALLGYRYWMDEPGNDVMWFWSENHALCFHAAQYLAGETFPDATFACSGRSGREQARLGRRRLAAWLADIEAHGFIEWNSPAYYPIDLIGLLCLHELAGEVGLRAAAARCLDRLFVMTALSTLDGIPSSTQGRSYDRDLKFPALTETSALAWVEWGRGALNPMAYAVPLLCLGSYAAPAAARRLALWDGARGIQARYTQGQGHAARLVAWKSRDALLGSVVEHRAGEPGYQAVVSQLHLAGHADARVWISNPGEDDPFGSRRPSYWAGDGFMPRVAQWRSLALLHYRLDDPRALPWTHAYARREAFDEYRVEGAWLFLRRGRALGAVMAAGGLEPVLAGPCAGYELRSPGRHNTWLLRAGSLESFGTLDGFAAALRAAVSAVTPGQHILLHDPEHGPVMLDGSGRFTVAGIDRRHRVDAVEPVLEPDDTRAPDRWSAAGAATPGDRDPSRR